MQETRERNQTRPRWSNSSWRVSWYGDEARYREQRIHEDIEARQTEHAAPSMGLRTVAQIGYTK